MSTSTTPAISCDDLTARFPCINLSHFSQEPSVGRRAPFCRGIENKRRALAPLRRIFPFSKRTRCRSSSASALFSSHSAPQLFSALHSSARGIEGSRFWTWMKILRGGSDGDRGSGFVCVGTFVERRRRFFLAFGLHVGLRDVHRSMTLLSEL